VSVRARLLRLADVTPAEWVRWQDLSERAAEANLAFDPRFLSPDQGSDGEDEYLFVVAEEDDQWFGVLRVFAMEAPPSLGVPTYGTWDPPLFGASHPLLDRSRAADALGAIARAARRELRSGFIPLRGYPASGPLADALQTARRRRTLDAVVVASHAAAWVDVTADASLPPGGPREFPADLDPVYRSTNTRRMLRRHARRLAETAHGPLVLRDASEDLAAIDRFVQMQASGWKGDSEQGGTAVALDARGERVFREKIEAFRASGDLIVLELWAATTCVYSTVVLVVGNVAMPFLDAYQHEFRDFSAGTLGRTAVNAHLRRLQRLVAVNPGIYDYYDEAAKTYPDRREFVDVVLGVGVVPSRAVRLLPRADTSPRMRGLLRGLARGDRLGMRALGAARRRLGQDR